jgi:hypothetical protein
MIKHFDTIQEGEDYYTNRIERRLIELQAYYRGEPEAIIVSNEMMQCLQKYLFEKFRFMPFETKPMFKNIPLIIDPGLLPESEHIFFVFDSSNYKRSVFNGKETFYRRSMLFEGKEGCI